jgi:hypothetical protein
MMCLIHRKLIIKRLKKGLKRYLRRELAMDVKAMVLTLAQQVLALLLLRAAVESADFQWLYNL